MGSRKSRACLEPWESGTDIHVQVGGAERVEGRTEKHSRKQLSQREEIRHGKFSLVIKAWPWRGVEMLKQNKSDYLVSVPAQAPEACLRIRKRGLWKTERVISLNCATLWGPRDIALATFWEKASHVNERAVLTLPRDPAQLWHHDGPRQLQAKQFCSWSSGSGCSSAQAMKRGHLSSQGS